MLLLRSETGRIFEIPMDIALRYEKLGKTGFLARKEEEYEQEEPTPTALRAQAENSQYEYWMSVLNKGWNTKQGGCSITIPCHAGDPGLLPENQKRLEAEGIGVNREETWERMAKECSSVRRLTYHFFKLV
jgi:hypothetical protein